MKAATTDREALASSHLHVFVMEDEHTQRVPGHRRRLTPIATTMTTTWLMGIYLEKSSQPAGMRQGWLPQPHSGRQSVMTEKGRCRRGSSTIHTRLPSISNHRKCMGNRDDNIYRLRETGMPRRIAGGERTMHRRRWSSRCGMSCHDRLAMCYDLVCFTWTSWGSFFAGRSRCTIARSRIMMMNEEFGSHEYHQMFQIRQASSQFFVVSKKSLHYSCVLADIFFVPTRADTYRLISALDMVRANLLLRSLASEGTYQGLVPTAGIYFEFSLYHSESQEPIMISPWPRSSGFLAESGL